ncbi:MAG: hypothetical protein H0X38_05615 [Planctomycetes bacterium]|nr:hypothetical protein [Planctomycetota bacterium]
MTTTSATSGTSAAGSLSGVQGQNGAFRNADFLHIMLSELTNQDPMSPQDTSKMVQGMQQLQQLANTQYQGFRDDLKWGAQLVGQKVTVLQDNITADAAKILEQSGVNPDVGYTTVNGTVQSFRSVNESVWVTVGGKDYPIANVQQLASGSHDGTYLAQLSQGILGATAGYGADPADKASSAGSGKVTGVSLDDSGTPFITINGQRIPYSLVNSITMPGSTPPAAGG